MNYRDRYATVKRSLSLPCLIMDTDDTSEELDFGAEYCFAKVFCEDISGMPVGGTIQPLAGGFPMYSHDGDEIVFDVPTEGFTWEIVFMTGQRKLTFKLSANASADVLLTVTGYEMVED